MNKRRTADEWRELLIAYEQSDATRKAFCAEHGVYPSMIEKAQRRFGVKHDRRDPRNLAVLQGTAPVGPRKRGRIPPAKREQALALYQAGDMSYAEVARQLNVNPQAVHYWVKTAGAKAKSATNGAAPVTQSPDVRTAIALLRQMDKEVMRLIRANKIQAPDRAHMLGMMALRELTGDQ